MIRHVPKLDQHWGFFASATPRQKVGADAQFEVFNNAASFVERMEGVEVCDANIGNKQHVEKLKACLN